MAVPKRRRLGVALLVDSPVGIEIDGLRRGLGDPRLGAVPAHITLVPPLNVSSADLAQATAVLRAAASKVPGPITLTLGPPRSFLPDNPVVYLGVEGEPAAMRELRALREAVFVAPLHRKLSWPWVPHVTVLDTAEPEMIESALGVLGGYRSQVSFERVVILELGADRAWVPLTDVLLGPAARVGTGGLAVELSYSRLPDTELAETLEREIPPAAAAPGGGERPVWADRTALRCGGDDLDIATRSLLPPVFVTARREGSFAGAAWAWLDRSGPVVVVWVRPGLRRQGIGSTLLAQLELRLRREGWQFARLSGFGPAGFFERRSGWSVPVER